MKFRAWTKIFETLTNLNEIYLSKNNLTIIPKDLFKNNLKLAKIWLNDNKISSIDSSMFDHLPKLGKVDMTENSCADKVYYRSQLEELQFDLKANCIVEVTVNDLQHLLQDEATKIAVLEKKIDAMNQENSLNVNEKMEVFKKQMTANYEVQIGVKSEEIKELKRINDKMAQKIELIENKYKVLSEQIEAINETTHYVSPTFEG